LNFKGHVAVITGGASGIGKATACELARLGADLAIIDTNEAGAQQVAASLEGSGRVCLSIKADVGNAKDVDRAIDQIKSKLKRIDFLFNNAGVDLVAPLLETSEEDWDRVIDTNLKGAFLLSKKAVAVMLDTGGGVIVNNASDAGLRALRLNTAYSVAKAGLVHLTRSIALDYASQGIRCNCICPGCIDTPLCQQFNVDLGARQGKSGEALFKEFIEQNVPMRRIGTGDEVAALVAFLCSDQARYINGAIIPIDGGLTAGI
jgi:meso-butanediol dehydrogenase/(S,S)-butanediol dehydrogenase/diacetyl reductase